MLDPNYLLHISEGAEEIAEQLHIDIIRRLVKRIMIRISRGESYILTAQDKWQIENLQEAGYLMEDIQKVIAKATKLQQDEIAEAMQEAGVKAINYEDEIYRNVGLSPKPLPQSPHLVRLMQRAYEATAGEWKNYTRTTADTTQRLFVESLDKAYHLVTTGAMSYTQAVREVINNIVSDGVKVTYPTGREDTIETATLRAVRTGVSQATSQIQMARATEMGADKVIISSHLGARPSHQVWQGKIFAIGDLSSTVEGMPALGTAGGLCGVNCRHSWSVWYDGMDNPFERYESKENLEQYEKEQYQRTLERRIRKTKREVMGLKEAVDNCKDEQLKFDLDMDYQRKSALLARQNKAYKDYCEENDLKPLNERLAVAKWDRQQAAAARGAAKRYESAHGGSATNTFTKTVTEIQKPEIIRLSERQSLKFGTVEEAEEYCMKFVNKNGFKALGKKSVNLKGLDIEVVNDITSELDRVFDETDLKKFDSIEVFGKTNKKYWEHHQDAPMATSNLGNLFLNREILKNKKTLSTYHDNGKKAFDFVISKIDALQGAERALAKRYKAAGRSLVSGDLRDMLLHETGHHLSHMQDYNAKFKKVMADTDWLSWSEKISGYAGHSEGEYIAESWVAFNLGEDVQPEMQEIFESVVRNGQK